MLEMRLHLEHFIVVVIVMVLLNNAKNILISCYKRNKKWLYLKPKRCRRIVWARCCLC